MEEFQPVTYNYSFFHLIFALASCYIAMLMTGWGTGAEEKDLIDVGWFSVWVSSPPPPFSFPYRDKGQLVVILRCLTAVAMHCRCHDILPDPTFQTYQHGVSQN